MHKKLFFLFMVMFILFSSETFAGIKRICKVKYETDYGWSKEYKVEVTFMTGKELNKATSSFQYSSFSNYCLIWFDNDEVAILEIKTFLMSVGDEFDRDDFINAFQITSDISCTQVNNESKTKWKIIAKEFISFIDPIENE